jgi:hypothetical protein
MILSFKNVQVIQVSIHKLKLKFLLYLMFYLKFNNTCIENPNEMNMALNYVYCQILLNI